VLPLSDKGIMSSCFIKKAAHTRWLLLSCFAARDIVMIIICMHPTFAIIFNNVSAALAAAVIKI
jgi:hypothetical protein